MNEKHVEVSEYADELISVPRARLRLELAQVEEGVTLTHEGKLLVSCRITSEGMAASGFMARALGAPLPALGETVETRVTTAVLFRALSIAELDYSNEASFALLERMLEEAEMQRGGANRMYRMGRMFTSLLTPAFGGAGYSPIEG